MFPSSEKVIENKAAASNCFLDQFCLFFSWIDTKTVGFMDEHRYSPSLNGNVCSIVSYRDELYNVCKKQVIVWYLCSYYHYFNGLSNSQTTEIAKSYPLSEGDSSPTYRWALPFTRLKWEFSRQFLIKYTNI